MFGHVIGVCRREDTARRLPPRATLTLAAPMTTVTVTMPPSEESIAKFLADNVVDGRAWQISIATVCQ